MGGTPRGGRAACRSSTHRHGWGGMAETGALGAESPWPAIQGDAVALQLTNTPLCQLGGPQLSSPARSISIGTAHLKMPSGCHTGGDLGCMACMCGPGRERVCMRWGWDVQPMGSLHGHGKRGAWRVQAQLRGRGHGTASQAWEVGCMAWTSAAARSRSWVAST
eukprot:122857-Chlamydomonas_euryale.AAC.6